MMPYEDLITSYIPTIIRGCVIFGATLFGLAAKESLDCLTKESYKLRFWFPKLLLGLFVVMVVLRFAESLDFVKKIFPISAAVIAFGYESFAKWLANDFPKLLLERLAKNLDK